MSLLVSLWYTPILVAFSVVRSRFFMMYLQLIYTKGRPPWYDREGKNLKQPYVIGICGGSASGKTTVARRIIERLEVPWVTVLSMDSFYKVTLHYIYHVFSEGCEG